MARITTPGADWLKPVQPDRIPTPTLQWLPQKRQGRRLHRLSDDLVFGLEGPEGPTWIIVPQGFVTDLESIPRVVTWLAGWAGFVPGNSNPAAPVIHDYLYQYRGHVPRWKRDAAGLFVSVSDARPFTRREADDLFHWILVESGTPRWRADRMHAAVKRWGGRGWGL